MRGGFQTFSLAGLASAIAAGVLSVWLGGSVTDQRAALTAAAALAIGNVGAALWAAGEEERRRQPVAWARCGLVAAALNFVVLNVVTGPALHYMMTAADRTPALFGGLTLALGFSLLLVWLSLRLAWRRFAPKIETS